MSDVATKELPEHWNIATFGDIADLLRGVSYKKTDASKEPVSGKVPVLRANNIGYGLNFDDLVYVPEKLVKKEQYIKKGDIIIAMSSGSKHLVGKAAQANEGYNCAYGAFCANLRVTEGIDPKYVAYFYSSQENLKRISASSKGSNINNLKREHILEAPIPLAPPDQQKLIVAKIEELFSHIDAGIEALKKAKQLLKQYRQSVLKAAVTGELTKEWREKNKDKLEPASQLLARIHKERCQKWEAQQLEEFKSKGKTPKDNKWKEKYKAPLGYSYEGELPEIPDGWVWVSPAEIASTDDYALAIGPFGSNLKVSDYRGEGVSLVFVRNIRTHDYSTTNGKYVTHKKAMELRAHSISGRDVLITKMGEPPGDASIYPDTAPDAIITADCIKWRFSILIEKPELFVHIISSQIIKDQILSRTKGVAQKKISLGTFKSIAFPLPPLEEQAEILRELEQKFYASERLLKELDAQLLKIEKNKQSVLSSAFSGRLRN